MTEPPTAAPPSLWFGATPIGPGHTPFVIAEMSGNHNQSLDRALAIVEAAAAAGAHGLKLQTYTPDTLTLDCDRPDFMVSGSDTPWAGRRLYDLYAEAMTPWDWHAPLFERARALGMIPLSTPFDDTAVDLLESLDSAVYKIASFETNHLPLLRRVAATGKPVIMSTGMATAGEIERAVATLRDGGCRDIVLLKCTSTYPATPENTNIRTIPHMRAQFGCEVGLSDHTHGLGVAVAGVALGATVIEKHFTLSRADGGVDSTFSMEPAEMAALVAETERAWQALGAVSYGPTEAEVASRRFRRSLYIARDCPAGHVLTAEDVRIVRPGHGLEPAALDDVLGLPLARAVARGEPLRYALFKPGSDA
ncbi:pseudaminic acid synthase [Roseospira navarrensis]|uniref:Pseudaminic acid synthase n=1 Tax=Roseospira navarrensis TaxID=140058 RepID=A0A7X1ZH42_9PROT|nr:pseudaminic acid synthase [Roseospira navarrensis]MQX38444.1 pseudaminic acid synthase [Roseospira navarrensis]